MGICEDTAIGSVRDWLMELLKKGEWCQARQVGKALEMLVEARNRPLAASIGSEVEERNR